MMFGSYILLIVTIFMFSHFHRYLRIFEVERPLSALLLLRFGFFALLAYDLWLISLSHAPRYGAGDFNVSHIEWIDILFATPTPLTIGALYLACGSLSLWVAIGLTSKLGVFLCALTYCFSYFWSQADSYQHHYLLCLCLILFIGEPWKSKNNLILKALMWQMSLIYGWTALAKCEPVWLSGETLSKLVTAPEVRQTIIDWGGWFGLGTQDTFQVSAWGVMLGEWFAALAFVVAPLRPIAFLIVPWFHIMVEWIGFDIELFSYYMLLLNLTLLSPHSFWRVLDRWIRHLFKTLEMSGQHRHYALHALYAALCSLCSILCIIQVDLEGSNLGATIAGIVVFSSVFLALSKRKALSTVAITVGFCISLFGHITLQDQVSSSEFRFKYYRMWGGDLKRRGQAQAALDAYEKANLAQTVDQPARFIPAGDLALQLGQTELGIRYLNEGTQRRVKHLEDLVQRLVTSAHSQDMNLRREFERAARGATQAHQKLYRAYVKTRNPRAQEVQSSLAALQQMIVQTRAHQ